MTTSPNQPVSTSDNLPLFYAEPVLLRFEEHQKKALKPSNGFGFCATTNAVPLLISEFSLALRHYPIVFSDTGSPNSLAVLGLREGQNLFSAKNGSWRAGTYVPAYLRRYPFIVTNFGDDGGQLLTIDTACERFTDIGAGKDAEPLFNDRGGPSPVTEQAMAFCHAFHQDHLRGQGFGSALNEQGLLVQRQAEMKFPDNSQYTLSGFRVVDPEKFLAITDRDLLLDWHRRGWLAAINLHLASMSNWETLLLLNAQNTNENQQGVA